jgi:hypothetical protein
MAISKEFVVNLKGKEYPLFAGVLDAAHKAGLRSLTTDLIQIPSPENGHMAIVKARAEFEDGRVFEDLGDCSPASTSPMLVAASIRLASTRAKGRVLRDAVNVGQTLLEELPDLEDEHGHAPPLPVRGNGGSRGQYPAEPAVTARPSRAAPREPAAGSGPTASRVAESPAPPLTSRPPAPGAGTGGRVDERPAARETGAGSGTGGPAGAPAPADGAPRVEGGNPSPFEHAGTPVCSTATCGKPLTKGQYEVSLRAYGQPLCPACQKAAASRA